MATTPSKREPSNYLVNTGDEPEPTLEPIIGYASKPIVSLEEACQPLHEMISRLNDFVNIAKTKSKTPANNLTQDESAAIRLYTMQWDDNIDGPNASIYSNLNRTLRDPDRGKLQPWFFYLKLFLTALTKLPPASAKIVWRGVRYQDSAKYFEGDKIIWWGFSSCTKSLNVLRSNMFLGKTGTRTIFSIDTFDGRSVKDHSDFPEEDEVLLLPGTCLTIHAKLNPATDLHIIELKQIHPKRELLERPFTANDPLTHKIVAGDTFWALSLKYNCSIEEIEVMNPDVEPTKLEIGEIIRLPANASHSHSEIHLNEDSDVNFHMVFTGDTLERIAEWYHCTIQDLMNLNPDIQPNLLYPRQKLQLPRNDRTTRNSCHD